MFQVPAFEASDPNQPIYPVEEQINTNRIAHRSQSPPLNHQINNLDRKNALLRD